MSVPVFYIPSLHAACAPESVPGQVAFFPSGLPENLPEPACGEGPSFMSERAREAAARALPLNPDEAKAVLEEMLRMGEHYAGGGLLKELAASRIIASFDDARAGARDEFADLARFSESGEITREDDAPRVADWSASPAEARAASAQAIQQALLDCQKVLLLAYSLEERRLELARLEERYRLLEQSLADSLGEAAFSEEAAGQGSGPVAPDAGTSLSWRVVADAALPFLPEKGVLFTADDVMASDLREAGMLQPFPEDRADVCAGWPPDLVTGLLFVSLPAWRLVGRRGPLPERPWLEREVEVFVARPSKGWLYGERAGAAPER